MTKLKTNKFFIKGSRTTIRNQKNKDLNWNTTNKKDKLVLFFLGGGGRKEEGKKKETTTNDKPSLLHLHVLYLLEENDNTPVCFCVSKALLKKFESFLFFY